ncbi:anhydro-N-acetylmuramic acid kinase [Lampropedia hyalina DSM 16112]|jgi:anhydro-N-acetylmuramic acid kinase|uniref:Anhydro-N-acetylmuramic acid kinase n=1 Tax=Lampropedia hyalina DSM 16112 TaxID=1122156 RepID=A0A1M5DHC5_9BURK|nr:anhydro-N-acetylmuramic acid kinase [Lampropedia hyalina]SHF66388.1 anhydro-N-acetylmuramic acid kinase [Lampropedia hyalina DSM 16112]
MPFSALSGSAFAHDPPYFIGLMSGTSLDGVDAVLAQFAHSRDRLQLRNVQHLHRPFPAGLQVEFRALNRAGDNEIHRAALAGNALAGEYARAVHQLLQQAQVSTQQVVAIGAHGQTVRHQPGQFDGVGYTVQINQPALLAERTGIAVVADFRSRDVAAGGQGAPLVPAFHREIFGRSDEAVAVLNLGGIANLSLLLPDGDVLGLDTGPANTLLDAWCLQHTGQPWDAGGTWAASGTVCQPLLQQLLQEPYFARPGPKSTGLDCFHPEWLRQHLQGFGALPAQDVQATLVELTAVTAVQALHRHAVAVAEIGVCGGGVFNDWLMQRLQHHAGASVPVRSTRHWGVEPMQVEALAFAWLARQCLLGLPGNLPAATNATGLRVLGAVYPGEGWSHWHDSHGFQTPP